MILRHVKTQLDSRVIVLHLLDVCCDSLVAYNFSRGMPASWTLLSSENSSAFWRPICFADFLRTLDCLPLCWCFVCVCVFWCLYLSFVMRLWLCLNNWCIAGLGRPRDFLRSLDSLLEPNGFVVFVSPYVLWGLSEHPVAVCFCESDFHHCDPLHGCCGDTDTLGFQNTRKRHCGSVDSSKPTRSNQCGLQILFAQRYACD